MELLIPFVRQVETADGLSSSASSVLHRLVRAGPQRLTELARAQGVSQPGMTQLVGRLERDGLVRREASAADGRGVVVEVTDEGRELSRNRRAERVELLAGMIEAAPPEDRAAIVAALPALTRLIEARVG
ncbi:MarR family winged helix-turn-helix transcriptional regulator [Actinocorallia herbida]|uniref:MarR family winged helix-turn-helix transcriptional regulator n=1 Tax=Actinocorallia herbida TaxID=58109 RepID=UPI001B869702|nr:MarR family transcriptional regulator [Actinocorallia herbida]